jgi:hypothetical protein
VSDRPAPVRSRVSSSKQKAGIVLFALAVLFAVIVLAVRNREDPAERFRRQVRNEVPAGTAQAELLAWAERVGGDSTTHSYDLASLPAPPGKTLPEVAGLSRDELASFVQVRIPWGYYRVWQTGSIAANQMWVFFPMDPAGRVTGHHFFTLEELAGVERERFRSNTTRDADPGEK